MRNGRARTIEEFEDLVERALQGLSPCFLEKLQNVAVVVERAPSKERLKETGTRRGDLLLGLYEGIPETEWGKGFGDILPDKITVFQDSLEQVARNERDLIKEVRATVLHEIAHYFGLDEDRVEAWEQTRPNRL